MEKKEKEVKKIVLCDCCHSCPEVVADEDGTFLIRDDFGGQVRLTKKEFEIFLMKGHRLLK